MEKKEVNLFDYAAVFVKWRRLFTFNFLVVCVATAIISLILPKWYRATAVIMPPEKDTGSMNIASMLSNLPISGLGINLGTNETMNYLAMLRSRTVRENIVKKFDLQKVYDKDDIELTLKAFDQNIEFNIGKEGQIIIEVFDKVPTRATDIANTFVSELDSLNTLFKVQKARFNRIWLENRYNQNVKALQATELELKNFKERHGVIDIPEQTKAAILGAAELQAEIYTTEIELAVKERYLTPTHGEVVEARAKVQELKHKLGELEGSAGMAATDGNGRASSIFIPFSNLPDLALQYARLYREVLVQGKLYEVIFQMYEQAKIQEAKDTPTVQVLDRAQVPIRKAKPKRMIMVAIAGLISLIVTGLFVFIKESIARIETSGGERAEQLQWMKQQLRSDRARLFRR
jgi:uncharacterized protein involved in exopolysaccharide biosynthesis